MTLTTLVTGSGANERESAIAAALEAGQPSALILEGLADGGNQFDPVTGLATPKIARIAPGCPCCSGNLTMRVTLNRILRHPPARLFISLATSAHLEQVRCFLTQEPYNKLLLLTKDIQV